MSQDIKNSVVKTGTTILGIKCKDGVVMAADRQSTLGNTVANKNQEKAEKINDYLVMSGAGLAGAIGRAKKVLPAELKIKELRSKKRPTVKESANLLSRIMHENIKQPSMVPEEMSVLIAGYEEDGTTKLYSIDPIGSMHEVEDFDGSLSSGMPYVYGLLEREYKEGMTVKEGVKLAEEALKASTQRDVGSGYGMDILSITKDGIKKEVEQKITPQYKNK